MDNWHYKTLRLTLSLLELTYISFSKGVRNEFK